MEGEAVDYTSPCSAYSLRTKPSGSTRKPSSSPPLAPLAPLVTRRWRLATANGWVGGGLGRREGKGMREYILVYNGEFSVLRQEMIRDTKRERGKEWAVEQKRVERERSKWVTRSSRVEFWISLCVIFCLRNCLGRRNQTRVYQEFSEKKSYPSCVYTYLKIQL